jgi:hypothetical protein
MRYEAPIEIRAWIECEHCARIDKRVVSDFIPPALAIPMLVKACAICRHCGAHAVMYLQRVVQRVH